MIGRATFSDEDPPLYRYTLTREWARDLPFVAFVGLNPSTADATQDDNMIRRCIRFAQSWDKGGLVMLNLFAYRSTDPRALADADIDPVGPRNDQALAQECQGRLVVACWGTWGSIHGRAQRVIDSGVLGDYRVLHLTKDGDPGHPLRLPKTRAPMHPDVARALGPW